MESNKRRLPRHVEGRIMVGKMPLKVFLIFFMPVALGLLILFMVHPEPKVLLFISLVGCAYYLGLSELDHKDTGFQILMNKFKYMKEGTLFFERSTKNVKSDIRCIRNKIGQTK
jgi:hypothetical protein